MRLDQLLPGAAHPIAGCDLICSLQAWRDAQGAPAGPCFSARYTCGLEAEGGSNRTRLHVRSDRMSVARSKCAHDDRQRVHRRGARWSIDMRSVSVQSKSNITMTFAGSTASHAAHSCQEALLAASVASLPGIDDVRQGLRKLAARVEAGGMPSPLPPSRAAQAHGSIRSPPLPAVRCVERAQSGKNEKLQPQTFPFFWGGGGSEKQGTPKNPWAVPPRPT